MRHADHDGSRRAEPAHLWLTGRALAPNGVTERSRRSLPPSDSSVRLAARRVVSERRAHGRRADWDIARCSITHGDGAEHGDRRFRTTGHRGQQNEPERGDDCCDRGDSRAPVAPFDTHRAVATVSADDLRSALSPRPDPGEEEGVRRCAMARAPPWTRPPDRARRQLRRQASV
jgi:hypothetical protein